MTRMRLTVLLFVGTIVAISVLAGRIPNLVAAGQIKDQSLGDEDSWIVYLPHVSDDYLAPSGRLCRFGVGGAQSIGSYDVNSLRLGWYLDWMATMDPVSPGGIGYMPMVRLAQTGVDSYESTPTASQITDMADQHRGATWLIGNEPDRILYQDDLEPHVYAAAYHDLYYLIKSADPTAKIAAGGIVQPTPLRLQYLDMVLDSYRTSYGDQMPVDVWNIHAFILREEAGSWGADIPPGIEATQGELYEIDDNASIDLFQEGILRFRQWMAINGYRDRPLIITEFGVQMPADYGFPPERVNAFMNATFDYLSSARDLALGYYADGYRLVQQWAWYSLTDANYNGWLFDADSRQRTVFGDNFAAYTWDLPSTVNLLPLGVEVDQVFVEAGAVVSATLRATVVNNGNVMSEPVPLHLYLSEVQPSLLMSETMVSSLSGCAAPMAVSLTWPDATAGDHTVHLVIDPQNAIAESDEGDNTLTLTLTLQPPVLE